MRRQRLVYLAVFALLSYPRQGWSEQGAVVGTHVALGTLHLVVEGTHTQAVVGRLAWDSLPGGGLRVVGMVLVAAGGGPGMHLVVVGRCLGVRVGVAGRQELSARMGVEAHP